MEIITNSLEETQKLAQEFAKRLRPGDIVAFSGELGAGKTSFIQGLAGGLGVSKKYYVNSPTFTILNVYEEGKHPIYHYDWYRLGNDAEVTDLGFEEYMEGNGITVIEWAEKFPNLLPERTIWIKMSVIGEEKRRIIIGERGGLT